MVAGLDTWQAFQLDIALAIKYNTLDKEEENQKLEVMLSAIDNVLRVQGAKIKKRKPTKSLIRPYSHPDEQKAIDDLPLARDVISQLSGGITFVNLEGLDNGK